MQKTDRLHTNPDEIHNNNKKKDSINHPFPSIEKKSRVQDSQIQSQMLKLLEPNSNNGAETEKKRTRENSPARWGKCSNIHNLWQFMQNQTQTKGSVQRKNPNGKESFNLWKLLMGYRLKTDEQ